MNPADRVYSHEHEWAKPEAGDLARVGLTHYAQEQLGDVVYLDLPKPGTVVKQSKKLGEVESVKAVSEIFSPVSGEVVEVNVALQKQPELVNQDPYGKGWLLLVSLSDPRELDRLLSATDYEALLKKEG